ncbi:hypothetical protein [Chelativorans sp. YIM 93263]|uniref:hypothetical protein n=1 Tax=Chelativorans sp. YIM 93263 TaxID=2906648 RepID=UPI0023785F4C|nr:hypothetical protein [Chelativorans sp. YIM 93263]
MAHISEPFDVMVINESSGHCLGVSNNSISDGETTSIIGILHDDLENPDVIWQLRGIPPIGQEISLTHKKTGAFLTHESEKIHTDDRTPSFNAIAKKGAEASYFFRDGDGVDRHLLSLGRAQYLTFRQIGAITAVWGPRDASQVNNDGFVWIIKQV